MDNEYYFDYLIHPFFAYVGDKHIFCYNYTYKQLFYSYYVSFIIKTLHKEK